MCSSGPHRPPAGTQVWPLACDLATSFRPDRAAFDALFTSLLAAPDALVLVAAAPPGSITGYLLASRHPAFHANPIRQHRHQRTTSTHSAIQTPNHATSYKPNAARLPKTPRGQVVMSG